MRSPCSSLFFCLFFFFFFFNDPAPPEIYPFPLPDALPISCNRRNGDRVRDLHPPSARRSSRSPDPLGQPGPDQSHHPGDERRRHAHRPLSLHATGGQRDRKSTRLNSSHLGISYAVFCLKKK